MYKSSWRVPKDLAIFGDRETFTITVACDTKDLYGKIETTRKIVLTPE